MRIFFSILFLPSLLFAQKLDSPYNENDFSIAVLNKDGIVYAYGNLKQNVPTKKWMYFHENGKIEAIGKYKNGDKIGKWVYYDQNGFEQARGKYKKGVKFGTWIIYEDCILEFKWGKLIKNECFDELPIF